MSVVSAMIRTMKKLLLFTSIFSLGVFGFWQTNLAVRAEQAGSSPESDSSSRIKVVYDSLVTLTHGAESAGSWGDWGAWWNRIRSAGEWVPGGDLLAKDVLSGKTFHQDSRTQQTGTVTMFEVDYDDLEYSDSLGDGDVDTEESTWTNTATNVWKDERTDFYWSSDQGQMTNVFPDSDHSPCPFFALSDRGDYDGLDADCGNAINTCGLLSLEAVTGEGAQTDWYLPSQKELMQAYIDGIQNQTSAGFVIVGSGYNHWSSTENSSTPANAWFVLLATGHTNNAAKTTYASWSATRCVHRD